MSVISSMEMIGSPSFEKLEGVESKATTDNESKTPEKTRKHPSRKEGGCSECSDASPTKSPSKGKSTRKTHRKKPKTQKPIDQKDFLESQELQKIKNERRSILKKPLGLSNHWRKDSFGTKIFPGGKAHQISFKKKLTEVIKVESLKHYNKFQEEEEQPHCTCNIF